MTTLSTAAARFVATAEGKSSSRAGEPAQSAARTNGVGVALELNGIHLSFGGVAALRDVDLAFRNDAITSVIGPNGAGKTSLINVISGVYTPDSGRIVIGGRAYSRAPTTRLASLGIARTFQNLGLFKGLSTFDNIALGLSFAGTATLVEQIFGFGRAASELRDARRRTEQALEWLGLETYRDRLVGALPYGVQKRIELARAIVAEPRFLLLDEPFAGMTVDDKAEMSEFIRSVQRRLNCALVLIEHDIGLVMSLSDRVAVLDYGRKIAEGPPAEVQANPAVIEAYLGAPHSDDEV